MSNELYYKKAIRDHLERIANLDELVGPIELVNGWYDDLYFPCQSDKDLNNDGVWERSQKEWRNCFSQVELDVLENFHRQFELVVDKLSEDLRDFSKDQNWKKLQKAAVVALREMGVPRDS
jgi:hypothetical protein